MADRRPWTLWPRVRQPQADASCQRWVDWAEAPGGFVSFEEVQRRAPYPRRVTFLRRRRQRSACQAETACRCRRTGGLPAGSG